MNLNKKKMLASRTLGVGKARIIFKENNLSDINEAITKQDIRDLYASGAIKIREITGSRRKEKRRTRRRAGSIKKKVMNRKRKYIILTRKLRAYLSEMRSAEKISEETYIKLRKEIKASAFKNKSHFKERIVEHG